MQKQDPPVASSPEPTIGKARPSRPPITASPAFAWVVALWFAALLGLGSLIVPVTLLESASLGSGLASMVPQAAPPLGFTAQALLALVGTVGGGALGFVLARRLRRPATAKAAPARRVLRASEDLDDLASEHEPAVPKFGARQPVNTGNRRRALAMAEDERPSDFLHVVPLPGSAGRGRDTADDAPEWLDEAEYALIEEEAPFELDASSELLSDELQDFSAPAALAVQAISQAAARPFDAPPSTPVSTPAPHVARQQFVAVAEAATLVVEPEAQPEPVRAAPAIEPLVFSPPSMLRAGVSWRDVPEPPAAASQAEAATPMPFEAVEPPHDVRQLFMQESEEDVSDKPIFAAPQAAVPPPVEAADGEGLVQLVQRLGATLEKHREWSAEQAAAQPDSAPADVAAERAVPEEFDPAAPDEAAQAMAAWFGKPAEAAPAVVEAEAEAEAEAAPLTQTAAPHHYARFSAPLAADEDEDDDEIASLAASFTLPLAIRAAEPAPAPRPAFDRPPPSPEPAATAFEAGTESGEDEELDDSAASGHFASLNPFRQPHEQFVRIEEPEPDPDAAEPAVLFPGQEASRPAPARAFDAPAGAATARPRPSNDDNERALREALLNLQRMGK